MRSGAADARGHRAFDPSRRGARIGVLAVTGFSGAQLGPRLAAAGFDRHLVKPVDLDPLVDAVVALARRTG